MRGERSVCSLLYTCCKYIKLIADIKLFCYGSYSSTDQTRLPKIFFKLLESLSCGQNPRTGLHISLSLPGPPSDLVVDEDEVNLPQAVIEVCGDVLLALFYRDPHRL